VCVNKHSQTLLTQSSQIIINNIVEDNTVIGNKYIII